MCQTEKICVVMSHLKIIIRVCLDLIFSVNNQEVNI